MNCNDVKFEINKNFKKLLHVLFVLNCSKPLNLSPLASSNSLENLSPNTISRLLKTLRK